MSRSFKLGSSASRGTSHELFRFNFTSKNFERVIPAPLTPRNLSASNRNISDADNIAHDPDGVNKAWPTALKSWRVMRKISSGRGGDLYQVVSNDSDTLSPHLLRVLSVKAMQSELWRLDALKAEAKVLQRLSAPGIPSYVDSFDAAVPGDHLHCLLLRLDSVPRDSHLHTVAALANDGWRPTEEQARAIAAQLRAILAHQRSFCPPYVHGSIRPDTVLIARAACSGDDAPGGGVSAWVVGPGWDDGRSAAGGAGEADLPVGTDLCGAGAALAHLTTLGGSRRLPPGVLGDFTVALLAGRWPVSDSASASLPLDQAAAALAAATLASGGSRLGRLARFGRYAETVIRRRPAGCRPDARLVGTDAPSSIGAAAADLPTCSDGGAAGAGRAAMLELQLPAGGLRGLATTYSGLAATQALMLPLVVLCSGSFMMSDPILFLFLICFNLVYATLLTYTVAKTAQFVLARTTVAVTARTLLLTRWLGPIRSKLVVERKEAVALRLIEGLCGWRAELEHGAFSTVQIGAAPMGRAEAEWVVALLVARWPELAARMEEAKY